MLSQYCEGSPRGWAAPPPDLIAASLTLDDSHSLAARGFAMLPSALIMRSPQNLRPTFLWVAICALAGLLLATNSAGQRDPLTGQQTSPAFRQAISDAAKKYKIPGIAAALIEHGRLRSIEVFGVRDLKSNAPVTVNTVFEAGSLGEHRELRPRRLRLRTMRVRQRKRCRCPGRGSRPWRK